ncbi:hypothetical protein AB0L85_32605 [Streptomyces sp. NPDC052051]|uniref:hypothetical protein n=1 Tax=Streptomyces sp. NPDC052051 TaxID=3154649 RepID=UPI0034298729
MLDTSGLRVIGVPGARSGLEQTFAEIEHLVRDCRFTDHAHVSEPGGAVPAAVEAGEIPQCRLDSYRQLPGENACAASRTDARLRTDREAAQRDITWHLRAACRFRVRRL